MHTSEAHVSHLPNTCSGTVRCYLCIQYLQQHAAFVGSGLTMLAH